MHTEQNTGIVTSVGQLGIDHEASNERSYWNEPHLYTRSSQLRNDWEDFRSDSIHANRRRAMMRTFATREVLTGAGVPIEAAVQVEDRFLVYLGENRHEQVAQSRNTSLPSMERGSHLARDYRLDRSLYAQDEEQLVALWQQFGWSADGVQAYIESNTNPFVLIRDTEERIAGIMIAESLQFGDVLLVELTEMAVTPESRGHGLASVLIRTLAEDSREVFGYDSLVYGEYNMTTGAHRSAARAGAVPGIETSIDGVLVDHVAIETGFGNEEIEPWATRWLHNFLVMHHR